MEQPFRKYSSYYNLLYHDKDYLSEVEYVEAFLKRYSVSPPQTILDLGCGTGNHDVIFARKGYDVTGIDLSSQMISIAKSRIESETTKWQSKGKLDFQLGDVRDIVLNSEFDSVISLFHVASYQTSNEDLIAYFRTAAKHLSKNGVFVFDFWYGPAVLTDKPSKRTKTFEDDELKIQRTASPLLYTNENVVEVNFEIQVHDKSNDSVELLKEQHHLRYLFLPEIQEFLKESGLEFLTAFEWMSHSKQLNFKSWYGVVVAKKKS